MHKIEISIQLGGEYTVEQLFPDGAPRPLTPETASYHLFGIQHGPVPAREVRRIIEELSLLESADVSVTLHRITEVAVSHA